MNRFFLSICIPSYNRPKELLRLLQSIDCRPEWNIEIVVCEDRAPKRLEVRQAVQKFEASTAYPVKYIENEINKGFDGNIRGFITCAEGEYILYMGDDDLFIPGKLDGYLQFLKDHRQLGYILRSYRNHYRNGDVEYYRYYSETKFFDPGEQTYIELFRKSVFISGFTFKRELAVGSLTDQFDATLLYQLYIQAEICLSHPSAYYNVPITEAYEGGAFYFGSSDSEKGRYVPNQHTVSGEATFISGFFKITRFIDQKYNLHSTDKVLQDMSKYSFPLLALVRENGRKDLTAYYKELTKLGFACTPYFKFYYLCLYALGPGICRKGIRLIKKVLGNTPKL